MYNYKQHLVQPVQRLLMFGFLCGACVFGTAHASVQGVFISSGGLKLENQTGWSYYQSDDAPEGAYFAANGAWTTQIEANVDLGQKLAAGDYTLFVKVIDYDYKSRVDATLGNATAGTALDDRDEDRYWTRLGPLHLTNSTGSVRLVFTKTAATAQPRILFRALYLIPDTNSNVTVTAQDQVMKLEFPKPADYDDSLPVKGNLLGNSSFEVGVGGGWSSMWSGKNWTLRSLWDTAVAYHGKASVRLESQTSPPQNFISLPIRLKPNKRYTLSAYVRCSGVRQYAMIHLVNSLQPPAGMPAAPVYKTGKLLSPSANWERLVLSDRILAYPGEQFHILLQCQQYEGAGYVWFDGVQLEEGDATAYQPRDAADIGVLMPRADSIFHPNDVQGQLLVANHASTSMVGNVKYEINDHMLRLLKQGTISVSVGANSTKSYALPVDVQKLGGFRGTVWTEDLPGAEEEFQYSVVPVPQNTGLDEDSTIGIHSDHTDWQLGMLQRMGIKWTRNLSPGAHYRWNVAEPTEGSFVWMDAEIQRPKNFGVTVLGNIGENAPAWAHRTYFTISSIVGSFQHGESVRTASGASGNIALVLDSTSATGWALQLTNVQGTFASGAAITGQASLAAAVITSPSYPEAVALDKWEAFVGSVVSHYKTDQKWWEIWNEPHLDITEVPSTSFYAEMLKRAMRAIKLADPGAKIVAMGGIYRPDFGIEVVSKLPASWTNDVAALSAHHYPGNGGMASLYLQTPQFYGKPVWNTETGTWDWGGFAGVNANVLLEGIPLYGFRANERFYRSAVDSPVLLARNFLQSVGTGARKYFYYDGRNTVSHAASFASNPTLVDYHEGLKPKGVAYAILAHLFDHSTGVGLITTKDARTEAYLFDRAGVPSVGIFSADGIERELDLSGLLGGGSIQVFDFMGNAVSDQNARVRYGRLPAYVVGSGVSVSQMRQALQLGGIQVLPDKEAPRLSITLAPRQPVAYGKEIYLRWLALDNVSLPDQVEPDALMFSWKLAGVDTDWTPWSAACFISYFNVPSGIRTFSVKARDKAGNVSVVQSRDIIVLAADGSRPSPKPQPPENVRVGAVAN